MSVASPAAPASLRHDAAIISLVGFAHGTSHFFHFVIPPLFVMLMAEFSLTFTQVGAVMSVFFVVSGVGQALAGFAVDRFGGMRVLCAGVGILSLSGLAYASAGSYPMLLAAAAIAGVGNCVFHPADYTIMNRRVSTQRLGHAFSVHGLSGSLGWAAAPVFVLAIAQSMGSWRAACVGASMVGFTSLAFLLANRKLLQDVQRMPVQEAPPGRGSSFAFLRAGVVWMCFLFFFLSVMAFGALQNFAPPLLARSYGISFAVATSALTAYLIGSAAGVGTGGFFAARGDEDRRVAISLAAAAMCAVALATAWPPAWSVVPLMAAMGFGVGFAGPSRDMLVRRAATSTFGTRAFGRVYGFVYSGIDAGLALAPLAFGPLMDAGRFTQVLWGVATLQVLAIGAALLVGGRSRR
ncbi:MAG TPA: MFS transporter [Usitatibacter sp.]|jgi:MFS family permease|nr:MFS transporter [Usitatibacter sp.]